MEVIKILFMLWGKEIPREVGDEIFTELIRHFVEINKSCTFMISIDADSHMHSLSFVHAPLFNI